MDDLVERPAVEVGKAVPGDLARGAVHVRDAQLAIQQQQPGGRVLGHGQREPALVVEIGVQSKLFDRHRGELGERGQEPFVVGVEIAVDAVRQLDQAQVAALVPDERHPQEPSEWWSIGVGRKALSPVAPLFELRLSEAEGPVGAADFCRHARQRGGMGIRSGPGVHARQVGCGQRPRSVPVDGQAGHCQAGADELGGARGRLAQHVVDRARGDDGQGR